MEKEHFFVVENGKTTKYMFVFW